jgi:hypothetical protein
MKKMGKSKTFVILQPTPPHTHEIMMYGIASSTMIKFGRVCLRGRRVALTNNLSAAAAVVVVCGRQATSIISRYDTFYCYDTLRSTQSSRWASSTRRSDPDMRQCNTVYELVQMAYDHLDTISPRGIAAFWSLLVKHIKNHRGGNSRAQLNAQLDKILCNTLENMKRYSHIDISTVAISLAKIMKQVESRGQRSATGSLHRNLHDLLIGGGNSEKKRFIFSKIATHSTPILSNFDARSLSNLIYSYGHAEYVPKDECGRTIMDILALEAISKLHHFNSQDLSNMLLSYAKLESSNSMLFKAAGDLIVGMNDLSEFWPQSLSNIIWAYATAGQSHPLLFQKLAVVAISRRNEFNSQNIANLLWAYATVGIIDRHLITSFAPAVKLVLSQCNSQNVANIAWAYAVANVNDPSLFNSDFMIALQAKANGFVPENLSQLHQWQLWQDEIKSGINLPPALCEKCCQAFVSESYQSSNLQDDVISVLSSIGLLPEEEVLTLSGYRLDAIVEVNGEKVGIEVDGPSHFINQEPTGSTLLKRRQVSTLDYIHIVSVPYWEWNKLGTDHAKKQDYLRTKLGLS